MTDVTGFEIDGRVYEVPSLGTFNLDEAQVLYDYSGLVIEDFLGLLPEATNAERQEHEEQMGARMRNPGLLRALMHIAYQRGNPREKTQRIKELVSNANALEALLEFVAAGSEGDDEVPLASTTEPERSSETSSVDSSTSSGAPSESDTDPQGETPGSTGAGRSDTSPTVPPIRLAG
jgi:hypothetical protein